MASGVVAALGAAAVLASLFVRGPRPEEAVARAYLEAVLTGDVDASYDLTTPAYRSIVFRPDQATLVAAVHELAGDDVEVHVVGSERTVGSDPPESLVGYTADTAAGTVEGIVTLFEVDGAWRVADASYRFVDASQEERRELQDVIDRLQAAVEERAGRLGG